MEAIQQFAEGLIDTGVAEASRLCQLLPSAQSEPYFDIAKLSFWLAVAHIIWNPLMWNCIARSEYKWGFLTKMFGGRKVLAVYFLASIIISLNYTRDTFFHDAVVDQPRIAMLGSPSIQVLAYCLYGFGLVLVTTSFLRLGVVGTYLGDYFGILMEERVNGFPFNIMENPMYNGASILALAHAIRNQSLAGIVLSAIAFTCYQIAVVYEDIYQMAEMKKKQDKKRKGL